MRAPALRKPKDSTWPALTLNAVQPGCSTPSTLIGISAPVTATSASCGEFKLGADEHRLQSCRALVIADEQVGGAHRKRSIAPPIGMPRWK